MTAGKDLRYGAAHRVANDDDALKAEFPYQGSHVVSAALNRKDHRGLAPAAVPSKVGRDNAEVLSEVVKGAVPVQRRGSHPPVQQ
jgi:hypothetical protein